MSKEKTKPTYDLELEVKNKGYRYVIGVDEAGRGCEYPDAEVLTNNGWKHYYDIDISKDKVLSYTPEGNIDWQPINFVVEKDFDGDLIELKNRSIHMLVTPDHYFEVLRRVFKRDKLDSNKLKMVGYKFRGRKLVSQLTANDFIPRGGNWVGDNLDTFILPSVDKHKYNNTTKDYGEKLIPMEVWVAFMGIYLAEGSCRFNESDFTYSVTISQYKDSIYYNDIEILLNKLPFDVKSYNSGFVIYDKQLASYMRQFGDVYIKYIPEYIKKLNANMLNIFIQWAIKGDGSCYTNKNRQEICMYYTVSEKLCDDFEEVILKAGWTYKTVKRLPRNRYISGRLIKKENQRECFEIRLRQNNKAACKYLHKKLVPYKGKVFCLSLSKHHNFFVRRSGSGYFTGNSLMGPVVAAGVIIPEGFDTSEINDSKKLSEKKRNYLYTKITEECDWACEFVNSKTIDEINIREATKLAMAKVLQRFDELYPKFALIDGNFLPPYRFTPMRAIIGGDNLSVSIAAASIIAKVERDRYVLSLHEKYPIYSWNKNKGYGTKEHRDALKIYGPTIYHRKSFGGVLN